MPKIVAIRRIRETDQKNSANEARIGEPPTPSLGKKSGGLDLKKLNVGDIMKGIVK